MIMLGLDFQISKRKEEEVEKKVCFNIDGLFIRVEERSIEIDFY